MDRYCASPQALPQCSFSSLSTLHFLNDPALFPIDYSKTASPVAKVRLIPAPFRKLRELRGLVRGIPVPQLRLLFRVPFCLDVPFGGASGRRGGQVSTEAPLWRDPTEENEEKRQAKDGPAAKVERPSLRMRGG